MSDLQQHPSPETAEQPNIDEHESRQREDTFSPEEREQIGKGLDDALAALKGIREAGQVVSHGTTETSRGLRHVEQKPVQGGHMEAYFTETGRLETMNLTVAETTFTVFLNESGRAEVTVDGKAINPMDFPEVTEIINYFEQPAEEVAEPEPTTDETELEADNRAA